MLSYNDMEFTDDLITEMTTLVDRASDEAVLNYIRGQSELSRGFQLKKVNCAAFRKRIKRHITTLHELDAKSAEFLYMAGIGQEFVTVLSHAALQCHCDEFAAIFGHAPFTLALLLDDRSGVREIGGRLLANRDELERDTTRARAIVADNMRNFAGHFSGICGTRAASPIPESDDSGERLAELERQLRAEQKRNADLKALLKEEKDAWQLRLSEKAKRIERLVAERHELRSSRDRLRSEEENLRETIGKLEKSFEADMDAAVACRLQGITHGWLSRCVEFEQESGRKGEADDLLARAEEAIARQALADRHSGDRREVRRRLDAVSAKLEEVRDMRANALHPVAELAEVEAGLAAEEERLSALLGKDDPEQRSALVQSLAARINSDAADGNLYYLEQLVDELRQLGLPPSDYSFLQSRLGDRYDRLLSKHGDRPMVRLPLGPALRFRLELARGAALNLVCDGHNMLNNMDAFKTTRHCSHAEARKALSETISGLLHPYRDCTATIVYDGPEHSRFACSDNVTVIYSGGGKSEKHRADRRIEELLNWRQYSGGATPVCVVTADCDLGRDARECGAEVIPLEQFGWMLKGV